MMKRDLAYQPELLASNKIMVSCYLTEKISLRIIPFERRSIEAR